LGLRYGIVLGAPIVLTTLFPRGNVALEAVQGV
jgi:hypothetical protein